MSAMRTSLTEPFALQHVKRVRESFADWFDSHDDQTARASSASLSHLMSFEPPEMILVRGAGELHPATAGAMTGALAAPAAMGLAGVLAAKSHHAVDLPGTVASLLTHGASHVAWVGWTAVVVMGALLGTAFAMITRRLRSFPAMIAFGVIIAACSWTIMQGLALPRIAPWLAKMLPYGPMVIASAAFGALLALQVPVRTRRLV